MGLPKGTTNNKAGRPLGSGNKIPPHIKDKLVQWTEDSLDEAFKAWSDIKHPFSKVQAFCMIIEYAIPKQARQEIAIESDEDETTGIKIEIVKSKKPE